MMTRTSTPAVIIAALVGVEVMTACFRPPEPPAPTPIPDAEVEAMIERSVTYVPIGGDRLRQEPAFRASPLRATITSASIRRSTSHLIFFGTIVDTRTGAPPADVRVVLGTLEALPGSQSPTFILRPAYTVPVDGSGYFSFEYPIEPGSRLVMMTGSEPALVYNVGRARRE